MKARGSLLLAFVLLGSLARSATLEGYVRDSHGSAIAGAVIQVQFQTANGAPETSTSRADEDGHYRLSSLHAGTYTLRTTIASSGQATYGPFQLAEGQSQTVDLVLKPADAATEFFDEPKFIVAGVTESTYVAGHGSEPAMRSNEALAKAAASLSEKSSRNSSSSSASEADLHRRAADASEKQGHPLEAVREYQRAAELEPSETNLFDWGTELLTHAAPAPAGEVFSKGIKLFPRSSRLLLGAAVAAYAQGDYPQAAQRFFAAADLNPADPDPYLFLGKIQTPEIAQSDGYRERMARFARLEPQNAWANYYYAMSLKKSDIGAQSLLENVVRLDPQIAPAYLQLGIFNSEKRNFSSAVRLYRKAIEIDPQLEQAHYRLAQAYLQTGQTQEAKAEAAIFQQLRTTSEQERERRRSELQRFIVKLKN